MDTYSVFDSAGKRILSGAKREKAIQVRDEEPLRILAREEPDAPTTPVQTAAGCVVAPPRATEQQTTRTRRAAKR
jgi:hypothetical protein